MNIRDRILAVMERQTINKKQLAERMGLQAQNINSTVLDNPKFDTLEKVAHALGISLAELVEEEDCNTESEPQQRCPYCGHELNIRLE